MNAIRDSNCEPYYVKYLLIKKSKPVYYHKLARLLHHKKLYLISISGVPTKKQMVREQKSQVPRVQTNYDRQQLTYHIIALLNKMEIWFIFGTF